MAKFIAMAARYCPFTALIDVGKRNNTPVRDVVEFSKAIYNMC
jgi:hypothetical protein